MNIDGNITLAPSGNDLVKKKSASSFLFLITILLFLLTLFIIILFIFVRRNRYYLCRFRPPRRRRSSHTYRELELQGGITRPHGVWSIDDSQEDDHIPATFI
uniref:Uncharacterized protein n=1 Tax=Aureoumbra lagunensis TaxID=44058 RepID=A0A7S3JX62_9STRA|mmetsp:Transcript_11371/g.15556  ORF Transcript_11371/g.15556 Transcript_11371/m.15556 type:complete len:102 (+) Transcript_11371:78-383(+)